MRVFHGLSEGKIAHPPRLPLDDPPDDPPLLLPPPSVPMAEELDDVPPPHDGIESTPQTHAHTQPARDRHRMRPTSPHRIYQQGTIGSEAQDIHGPVAWALE